MRGSTLAAVAARPRMTTPYQQDRWPDDWPRAPIARRASIRFLLEYRLNRAGPLALELLDQLFGRRDPPRDDVVERLEMASLVAIASVSRAISRAVRPRIVARKASFGTASRKF